MEGDRRVTTLWLWTDDVEDTGCIEVSGDDCQVMTAHAQARGSVLVAGTMAGYGAPLVILLTSSLERMPPASTRLALSSVMDTASTMSSSRSSCMISAAAALISLLSSLAIGGCGGVAMDGEGEEGAGGGGADGVLARLADGHLPAAGLGGRRLRSRAASCVAALSGLC